MPNKSTVKAPRGYRPFKVGDIIQLGDVGRMSNGDLLPIAKRHHGEKVTAKDKQVLATWFRPLPADAKATKKRKLVSFLSVVQQEPLTRFPGFHIKEDAGSFTPVAVVPFPQGCTKPGDIGFERQQAHAELIRSAPDLLRALRLHVGFLATLPTGWLGKTVADIGMLNDAYLASSPLLKKLEVFAE